MLITCQLPRVYPASTTITEPGKASTITCALHTDSGNISDSTTYSYTCSASGVTVSGSRSGNILTLSFTAPATSVVARGSTYTITVTASANGATKVSTITLTQNDVLKTSKPTLKIYPVYNNEAYDVCVTEAATAAKVLNIKSTRFSLTPYVKIGVHFFETNSATGTITLNVNSTGAKPIKLNGSTTTSLSTDTIYTLMYYDDAWNIVNSYSYAPTTNAQPHGYGSDITSQPTRNFYDRNTLVKLVFNFSAFSTFYWYEAQGQYPPTQW